MFCCEGNAVSVGWVYDRMFLNHDPGSSHPERPDRLRVIVAAIEKSGLEGQLTRLPFRSASPDQLALVHDPAYIDIVRMMCDEQFTFIGTQETGICTRSYDVAAMAVGGVLAACDAVIAGKVRRVFCAIRPPGHHAVADQAMGFCLFNNVATGAEYLVRTHGLKRIAIVDFDAHHGNGTQHIFNDRKAVFYISIHERPGSLPFPGTGQVDEIGSGPGVGCTLNIPLDRGAGEAEFVAAMDREVIPALDRFRPDFILVSAGFDALSRDNTSNLGLRPASFGIITDALVQSAEQHAGGRLVSVLEGGYDLPDLGPAVVAHLRSLLGGHCRNQ